MNSREPYVPEPALARLAGLWDKITGAASDDDEDGDLAASAPAAGGAVIQGTGRITANIGQARAVAAEDPPIPPIPPGMEAHAAQLLAERRRQFLDQYTDVTLPERDQAILLALLAAPGGTSTRRAAEAIGRSHMTVSRQFHRWRHDGAAEVRGRGSGRR